MTHTVHMSPEVAVIEKLLDRVIDAMSADNLDADVRRRVINRVMFGEPMPEPVRRADEQLIGDLDNWKPTGFLGPAAARP